MKNMCGLIKNMHDIKIQDEYTCDFKDLFMLYYINIINSPVNTLLRNLHANNIDGDTLTIVNYRKYIV